MLQDPFLFSGTIADNIRFGRPEATDDEVVAAAHAIGVDRVAARFDGGLEHVVREGGAGLSAGERQLISIARALLADPRILILDEATSNIDRPSEILIEHAFDTLLRGRTSMIIAHRLATVRRADEILVVEKGRVAQRGTEAELLAEDGPFRRLAETLHGLSVRDVGLEHPDVVAHDRRRLALAVEAVDVHLRAADHEIGVHPCDVDAHREQLVRREAVRSVDEPSAARCRRRCGRSRSRRRACSGTRAPSS